MRLQEAANRCVSSLSQDVLGCLEGLSEPRGPSLLPPCLSLQEVLQSSCSDPRGAGTTGPVCCHPGIRAGPRESHWSSKGRAKLGSHGPVSVGSFPRPRTTPHSPFRASHCGDPTVLSSKALCPAGLAKALESQAQAQPRRPVGSERPGVPHAQVFRELILSLGPPC